ncbi:MAG TPA: hypothetical protein VHJ59_01075 [Nitrososphaera sp.]|nr:hypothetical protein [Nitrososphaera sp.]
MNEVPTTKLLAITAVIFVTAALISLPYQSQVANAAPSGKKYQVYITLTGVPDNAGALYLNGSLNRALASSFETTVSSPTEGQTLKFVLTVSSRNVQSLIIYGEQVANPDTGYYDEHTFTGKVNGPIRVDFSYPT